MHVGAVPEGPSRCRADRPRRKAVAAAARLAGRQPVSRRLPPRAGWTSSAACWRRSRSTASGSTITTPMPVGSGPSRNCPTRIFRRAALAAVHETNRHRAARRRSGGREAAARRAPRRLDGLPLRRLHRLGPRVSRDPERTFGPQALLGTFHCPWSPEDYDGAIRAQTGDRPDGPGKVRRRLQHHALPRPLRPREGPGLDRPANATPGRAVESARQA